MSAHYATQMIHFKAVPVLNIMVKQTKEDRDLQDDLEFLHEKLNSSLQDLRHAVLVSDVVVVFLSFVVVAVVASI